MVEMALENIRLNSSVTADLVLAAQELLSDPTVLLLVLYLERRSRYDFDLSSLAAAISRPRTTTYRLIGQAQKLRLIDIVNDPADQRRTLIKLSEAGISSAEQLLRKFEHILRAAHISRKISSRTLHPLACNEVYAHDATPLIKKVYEWSKSSSDAIPTNLLDRLLIFLPNWGDLPTSRVRHWGVEVWKQIGGLDYSPRTMEEIISSTSKTYLDLILKHYFESQRSPKIYRIEVDSLRPNGERYRNVFERLSLYIPDIGVISCTDFIAVSRA